MNDRSDQHANKGTGTMGQPQHKPKGGTRRLRRLVRAVVLAMVTATPVVGLTAGPAQAGPEPTITMTASASTVSSGDALTYTITVVGGDDKMRTTQVTDQLNGMSDIVLTSSRGYCFESNLLVTCQGGSLVPAHKTPWVITIRGTVNAADGEYLNNTATVTGRKPSPPPYNKSVSTRVLVDNGYTGPLPDLTVTINAPDQAPVNSNVDYTLTVNNGGGAGANDLKVTATLPPGFGATSATGTNLFACSIALPTVTCTGGRLDTGANATIIIHAVTANDFDRYTTTAVVDPEDAVEEGKEGNNTSSQEIFLPAAPPPTEPLTFTKSGPTQIRVGDILTYTLRAQNLSSKDAAEKLVISDGTQGLDAASVTATTTDPKLLCNVTSTQVVCNPKGDYKLDKLKTVIVTIAGRIVATPGTIIRNTATLTTKQHNISITRRSTVSTTVRPPVDLTVTQFASCNPTSPANPADPWGHCPFRAHDQYNLVISVGNSGLDDATNVRVREPLPAGVVFEGFTNGSPSGGFSCSESGGVVSCTGGTVPGQLSSGQFGGTTRQITLHLTAPNQAGPITSTVTVDPFNAINESDENNNTATTTVPVQTGIDLTIMKTANFDPVAPNGTLVYSVIVSNIGTADATGVKIADILPANVKFRSAAEVPNSAHFPYAPAHGFTCTHDGSATGGTVTCTGGHLQGQYAFNGGPPYHDPALTDTATIEITVFAPAATGPVLNQAIVDPDNQIAESNENNNISILETEVEIPATPGSNGTYIELTVDNAQTAPAAGAPVSPNGTLEYTLTVKNFGSAPATNISLQDVVPQGSRFRSANSQPLTGGNGGFICSFATGVVQCGNGALAGWDGAGAVPSATIVIKLFAPGTTTDGTSNFTNHAVVDPANTIPEADETNNVSDVLTVVKVGGSNDYNQLTITNAQLIPAGNGHVAPSGTLIYRLNVTNTGSDRASGILVRDYLPAGTTFRSARLVPSMSTTGTTGFVCTSSNGVVDCRNGTLLSAGTAVIDVTLFAPAQPVVINNQAAVDPDDTIPEGNEEDNTSFSDDTTVDLDGSSDYIELSISELTSAADPSIVTVGDDQVPTNTALTYTMKVKNDGSDRALNVRAQGNLPAGTTFVSANDANPGTSGAFSCTQAGGVVDCTGGSIPAGSDRTIKIVVRSPGHGDITLVDNKAVITFQGRVDPANAIPEGDETNNAKSVSDTVLASVDLEATENTPCSGQGTECDLTFKVKNNGPDPVTNVTVETSLPVGVIPLDVAVENEAEFWSCQIEENPINKVTCTGTKMASGAEASFKVHVYVTSDDTLNSTTVVDPGNTIVETNETNNTKQGTA